MRQNRLLNLLARNAKHTEFRCEASNDGATIYMYGPVVDDEWDAEWLGGISPAGFIAALGEHKGKPIALRINSPGGSVFAAQAISQAIREHDATVTAHVDGYAASAASIISTAADRVVMAPGSMLMIHKAWSYAAGNADELMQLAALLDKIDGQLAEGYATRSGKHDASHFAELMAAETWFTPEEAIGVGLADDVAGKAVKNVLTWDLSAYGKAPKLVDPPEQRAAPAVDVERRKRQLTARLLRAAA